MDVTFSRRARMRLALSEACADLSDYTRGLVWTYADDYARSGDLLDQALRVRSDAQRVVELAVAYERRRGTSWETIGETLGISRQAAHERYAAVVAEMESNLAVSWALDDPRYPGVPDGAGDPQESAERLDRWVNARIQSGDSLYHDAEDAPRRQHPVSVGLPEPSHTDTTNLFLTVASMITAENPRATDELKVGFARRKVELYETLVAEETAQRGATGTPIEDLRDQLAGARARLAELTPAG